MKTCLTFVAVLFVLNSSLAQREVFSKSNQAIQGFDPVAYFKEAKPVKGKSEFSYAWKGSTWYFSNQENLNDFKANPDKFAPQFGGYCAYGVADGHKASTSPDAWTVVNGKLYLNYDKDVRELWKKDQKVFIKTAEEKWPQVKNEKD
jgi:YHS domain-containing protein